MFCFSSSDFLFLFGNETHADSMSTLGPAMSQTPMPWTSPRHLHTQFFPRAAGAEMSNMQNRLDWGQVRWRKSPCRTEWTLTEQPQKWNRSAPGDRTDGWNR